SAAGLVGILLLGMDRWVMFYLLAKSGLAMSEVGFRYHQLLAGAMSLVVLGLPAGLLGAVLPLWMRALAETTFALADQVGRLLTWNTVGAVLGVLVTGFVLMPNAGLRGSFYLLAALLCLGALGTASAGQQGRRLVVP